MDNSIDDTTLAPENKKLLGSLMDYSVDQTVNLVSDTAINAYDNITG